MTIRFSLFAGIVAGVLATAATSFAAPASAGPAPKAKPAHAVIKPAHAVTVKAPHDFSARRHHWRRSHHWTRPHLRHCTTVRKHHRGVTVCR